jgi:hypothetical protein
LTSDLATITSEEDGDDSVITFIIIGVIGGALVAAGLTALMVFIVRRKSNSNNSVSLESMISNNNEGRYQASQSLGQFGIDVAISDEKLAPRVTKSWEINYSELKMLETVGEGAFGTVHRAIFRHQEVAVKQLKNRIDQKEVRKF